MSTTDTNTNYPRLAKSYSIGKGIVAGSVNRYQRLLKSIHFDHGVQYAIVVFGVSGLILLGIFMAIAAPLFGPLESSPLAAQVSTVAGVGVIGIVGYRTAREIKQRRRAADMRQKPTIEAAGKAIELLESNDYRAREHAARVLAMKIDKGAGGIVKRSARSVDSILGMLFSALWLPERTQATFHRDLAKTLPYFARDYSSEVLGHSDELTGLLSHKSPTVQQKAVVTIRNVVSAYPDASDEFIDPISKMANDDDPEIRVTVCSVLSRMESEEAMELMTELANDPHPDVRERAREVLQSKQSVSRSKAGQADRRSIESEESEFIARPPDVNLDDVAGMDSLKDKLSEQVIVPFEGGESYAKYDVGSVSGILFHGPPGTGKTYISQCLAGELGVNYADISVADIDSSVVGEGVENLQQAFGEARRNQPSLIFLDELDALGSDRSSQTTHEERKRQVNQLLEELSNIDSTDDLLVIGATNNPDDVDDALLRTGRFDTKIKIPKPDADARLSILKYHLPVEVEGLDDSTVIRDTNGFTSSDLAEVANQAARQAAYRERETNQDGSLNAEDVMEAIDVVASERGDMAGFISQPPEMNFDDVAGMEDLQQTLRETIIQPLANPELYEEYGVGVERGFLLYGPPGTGKTHITKCLAGELGINYIEATAGDLVSKWIGEGAENIQAMFEDARQNQPCLIFIDEIDAIATDRSMGSQQKSERQMVNQLLEELSGTHDSNEEIIVVGATNRLEALDDAILRTGRLGKTIEVPPPDASARVGILNHHLDAPTEDIDEALVKSVTEGLVSSDMEQIADTAARKALNRTQASDSKSAVTQEDIKETAIDLHNKN